MSDKDAKSGSAGKVILGTAFAAAAGYVAGILTAPKSGKETRQDIKDKASETYAAAEKELKKLHTELTEVLGQVNAKLKDIRAEGGRRFDEVLAQSNKAKDKVREMLSGLHDGEADDKDLQKAISDATKAVEELRAFLKK